LRFLVTIARLPPERGAASPAILLCAASLALIVASQPLPPLAAGCPPLDVTNGVVKSDADGAGVGKYDSGLNCVWQIACAATEFVVLTDVKLALYESFYGDVVALGEPVNIVLRGTTDTTAAFPSTGVLIPTTSLVVNFTRVVINAPGGFQINFRCEPAAASRPNGLPLGLPVATCATSDAPYAITLPTGAASVTLLTDVDGFGRRIRAYGSRDACAWRVTCASPTDHIFLSLQADLATADNITVTLLRDGVADDASTVRNPMSLRTGNIVLTTPTLVELPGNIIELGAVFLADAMNWRVGLSATIGCAAPVSVPRVGVPVNPCDLTGATPARADATGGLVMSDLDGAGPIPYTRLSAAAAGFATYNASRVDVGGQCRWRVRCAANEWINVTELTWKLNPAASSVTDILRLGSPVNLDLGQSPYYGYGTPYDTAAARTIGAPWYPLVVRNSTLDVDLFMLPYPGFENAPYDGFTLRFKCQPAAATATTNTVGLPPTPIVGCPITDRVVVASNTTVASDLDGADTKFIPQRRVVTCKWRLQCDNASEHVSFILQSASFESSAQLSLSYPRRPEVDWSYTTRFSQMMLEPTEIATSVVDVDLTFLPVMYYNPAGMAMRFTCVSPTWRSHLPGSCGQSSAQPALVAATALPSSRGGKAEGVLHGTLISDLDGYDYFRSSIAGRADFDTDVSKTCYWSLTCPNEYHINITRVHHGFRTSGPTTQNNNDYLRFGEPLDFRAIGTNIFPYGAPSDAKYPDYESTVLPQNSLDIAFYVSPRGGNGAPKGFTIEFECSPVRRENALQRIVGYPLTNRTLRAVYAGAYVTDLGGPDNFQAVAMTNRTAPVVVTFLCPGTMEMKLAYYQRVNSQNPQPMFYLWGNGVPRSGEEVLQTPFDQGYSPLLDDGMPVEIVPANRVQMIHQPLWNVDYGFSLEYACLAPRFLVDDLRCGTADDPVVTRTGVVVGDIDGVGSFRYGRWLSDKNGRILATGASSAQSIHLSRFTIFASNSRRWMVPGAERVALSPPEPAGLLLPVKHDWHAVDPQQHASRRAVHDSSVLLLRRRQFRLPIFVRVRQRVPGSVCGIRNVPDRGASSASWTQRHVQQPSQRYSIPGLRRSFHVSLGAAMPGHDALDHRRVLVPNQPTGAGRAARRQRDDGLQQRKRQLSFFLRAQRNAPSQHQCRHVRFPGALSHECHRHADVHVPRDIRSRRVHRRCILFGQRRGIRGVGELMRLRVRCGVGRAAVRPLRRRLRLGQRPTVQRASELHRSCPARPGARSAILQPRLAVQRQRQRGEGERDSVRLCVRFAVCRAAV
jgi:hypothetical protein